MELTDSMIESELQNTIYAGDFHWEIIVFLGVPLLLFLVFFFFKSEDTRTKVCCGLLAVVFIIMGSVTIVKNATTSNYIDSGEWIVVTDTVERVMESTKNGNKSYFMVLEKYGNVSLSYSEARQYHWGEEVYVVVVPDGNEYRGLGIAYSTDDYIYRRKKNE